MGPSVPLHEASPESSGHTVCLTCSPEKNWHCELDVRTGWAAPALDSLPGAFLFPKPQQKCTCNNMLPWCVRQAKRNADKVNFPASTMGSAGCIYAVLAEPSVPQHQGCDSAVSRTWLKLSLAALLTPFCPRRGGNWVCIQHWQTGGLKLRVEVLTILTCLSLPRSYMKQTSKFAHVLIYHWTTKLAALKIHFPPLPKPGLEDTYWVWGGHSLPLWQGRILGGPRGRAGWEYDSHRT